MSSKLFRFVYAMLFLACILVSLPAQAQVQWNARLEKLKAEKAETQASQAQQAPSRVSESQVRYNAVAAGRLSGGRRNSSYRGSSRAAVSISELALGQPTYVTFPQGWVYAVWDIGSLTSTDPDGEFDIAVPIYYVDKGYAGSTFAEDLSVYITTSENRLLVGKIAPNLRFSKIGEYPLIGALPTSLQPYAGKWVTAPNQFGYQVVPFTLDAGTGKSTFGPLKSFAEPDYGVVASVAVSGSFMYEALPFGGVVRIYDKDKPGVVRTVASDLQVTALCVSDGKLYALSTELGDEGPIDGAGRITEWTIGVDGSLTQSNQFVGLTVDWQPGAIAVSGKRIYATTIYGLTSVKRDPGDFGGDSKLALSYELLPFHDTYITSVFVTPAPVAVIIP